MESLLSAGVNGRSFWRGIGEQGQSGCLIDPIWNRRERLFSPWTIYGIHRHRPGLSSQCPQDSLLSVFSGAFNFSGIHHAAPGVR